MSTRGMPKQTEAAPMQVVGRHASVSELVRDTASPKFTRDFEQHRAERGLVNGLASLRGSQGLTQKALAERVGCGQPRISKIETATDAELSLSDILDYASALGQSVRITLVASHASVADRLRIQLSRLRDELARLEVPMPPGSATTARGVEAFALDTMRRMITVLEESVNQLADRPLGATPALEVEIHGRDEKRPPREPRPRRKAPTRNSGSS